MASRDISVVVETGSKRVFASALDWPGWARAARSEEQALGELRAYEVRYRAVAARTQHTLPNDIRLHVIEHVAGDGTTDFGAPSKAASAETRAPAAAEARLVELMQAAWAVFDDTVAAAPASLRKGPRGGGRDRDAIAEHVLQAEQVYARKIGVRHSAPALGDTTGIQSMRAAIAVACRAPAAATSWPVRYCIRRIAWHVLDHVWEIEDRSE